MTRQTTPHLSFRRRPPRVVVVGGGTGSFAVLQALKQITPAITALVSMADDGGSTGVLRDELGVLPPGDVRQCLVALSNAPQLRDLFNYRFSEGGLTGHSFGNLLLTALEKQTGNFAQAVETASQVLNITGRVVPITLDDVRLVVDTSDGRHLEGEHSIDGAKLMPTPRVSLQPAGRLNPDAHIAIQEADLVVIAPGDMYTSLAPALIVDGVQQALKATRAKVTYICNLVVKPGHTEGMDVLAHAKEVERLIGAPVLDNVLFNTAIPVPALLRKYKKEKEFLVTMPAPGSHAGHIRLVGMPLLAGEVAIPVDGDVLAASRSYIRHDPLLIQQALTKLLNARYLGITRQ